MPFTKEGFQRIRTIGNHISELSNLFEEIEKKDIEIYPREYNYLEKGEEILNYILYGADINCVPIPNKNLSLDDYCGIFEIAKYGGLINNIKHYDEFRKIFFEYKDILKQIRETKELPTNKKELQKYEKIRDFFSEYNKILREKFDFLFDISPAV